jgi:hypothetical protein
MKKIPSNTEYKSWSSETEQWYYPDHDASLIFVGNTKDLIDWNMLIESVKDKEGCILPKLIWPNPHFDEMKKLYLDSNYILESAEWINYYPGIDYDEKINDLFGSFVGCQKCARAWISRINPGKTAPWHWDLDDEESKYLKEGKLLRFVCKMNKDNIGQVTIIGNQVLYNVFPGDVYRWPDHRMWHGSVNCGLTPKYQFNYLGYI